MRVEKYCRTGLFDQPIQPTKVSGLRKYIGGGILIDHVDGEDMAKCRMLVFCNTTTGGSELIRLDGWAQKLVDHARKLILVHGARQPTRPVESSFGPFPDCPFQQLSCIPGAIHGMVSDQVNRPHTPAHRGGF